MGCFQSKIYEEDVELDEKGVQTEMKLTEEQSSEIKPFSLDDFLRKRSDLKDYKFQSDSARFKVTIQHRQRQPRPVNEPKPNNISRLTKGYFSLSAKIHERSKSIEEKASAIIKLKHFSDIISTGHSIPIHRSLNYGIQYFF